MIKIDNFYSQTLPLMRDSGWVCSDITMQEQINFSGISNINEFVKNNITAGKTNYLTNNVARFNIPVYQIIDSSSVGLHEINGVVVEDQDTSLSDWLKWSDYGGSLNQDIQPGNGEMEDGPVYIGLEAYVKYLSIQNPLFDDVNRVVDFTITNGVASKGDYKYFPMLVLNNPNIIQVHVGSLPGIVVDGNKTKDTSPENLKAFGYDAIPDTSSLNTSLPINLSYSDSDTTYAADSSSYSFKRQFYDWIYSGGITKIDSMKTPQKITLENITGIDDGKPTTPIKYKLYQNYPNPFNPTTTIKYQIPSTSFVTIKIYNILGKEIATLVNEVKSAGEYSVQFTDRQQTTENEQLSSGIYFYRIDARSKVSNKEFTKVGKMLLLK